MKIVTEFIWHIRNLNYPIGLQTYMLKVIDYACKSKN